MIKKIIIVSILLVINKSLVFGVNLYWPTGDNSFFEGAAIETLIQPTVSGNVESGKFGYVRNNGSKFHEGIDIKAKKRDRKGEALDKVIAAMDGQVVHINTVGGNSNYGQYIVIVHKGVEPSIYTLYGHLSSIDPSIKVGNMVKGGTVLGIMGRTSSGTAIPKERAHLHFEMGVMLSEGFIKWYEEQKFGTRNRHGLWNGFNLTGFDPLDFYEKWRTGAIGSVADYFKQLPVAFTLRVTTRKTPNFVKRYPGLVTRGRQLQREGIWDVDFTWFAMPFRWTPLNDVGIPCKAGTTVLRNYNVEIFREHNCKDVLVIKQGKVPQYGKVLKKTLSLLLDY